jgi:error-prone DNA polymerase
MVNVVCSPGVMKAHRQAARNKVAVVIRGIVERQDGVTNLVADRVETLDTVLPGTGEALQVRQSSRDFR